MREIITIIVLVLLPVQISRADSIEYLKYSFHEIDTSCIKNPGIDYELKNRNIFIDHLQFIIRNFSNPKAFKISNLLAYEDSIKAMDVSLGYFYSLDTAYYPLFNTFKFGKPYRFQRIECPIFDVHTEYFFTKKDKLVKVVGYDWYEHLPVVEDLFFIEDSSSTVLKRSAFEKKYLYIEQTLSLYLGIPIQSITDTDGFKDSAWKTKENINARQSMFGNYNEIRLFLYKD